MRALIIGNSATAVGAIEAMRQYDQSAEILVVTEEDYLIYSRPLLSHHLAGEIGKTRLAYRDADFYTRHNVKAVLNNQVVGIDTDEHFISTQSGQIFDYDKLLISTGGVPIVPPVAGIDVEGVYTFTRLKDVEGILG